MSEYIGVTRATNGFSLRLSNETKCDTAVVASSVDELVEHVRAWAEPPAPAKPKRARKPASK